MAVFDELLQANATYVQSFDQGNLSAPPARKLAVVTCMDARIDPLQSLGLALGDAHVIRNAGGRVSDDAIRSLVISERLLGTEEIVVIHHTGCGMSTFTNQDLATKIQQDLGVDVGEQDFLPFTDLEQSVRDDVTTLRQSPLIPRNIAIFGAIYDVQTGKLDVVVREPGALEANNR